MKKPSTTKTAKATKTPKAAVEIINAEPVAATPAKAAPATKKKATKPAKKAVKKPTAKTPGRETKGGTVIAMISRKGGATAAELLKATGWQAHSLRGFLSVANKKGLAKIASARNEAGDRVYSVA